MVTLIVVPCGVTPQELAASLLEQTNKPTITFMVRKIALCEGYTAYGERIEKGRAKITCHPDEIRIAPEQVIIETKKVELRLY
jgi:hypothetical protein